MRRQSGCGASISCCDLRLRGGRLSREFDARWRRCFEGCQVRIAVLGVKLAGKRSDALGEAGKFLRAEELSRRIAFLAEIAAISHARTEKRRQSLRALPILPNLTLVALQS
jgi:hypothetical protein